MSARLADRLTAARRRSFVGRQAELAAVRDALRPDAQPAVFYVYGPGGVGKTTLLRQCVWLAETAGRPAVWVDARDLGGTPPDGLCDLSDALLVFDTAEALDPLDRWLREDLLPNLADGVVVIVAGREGPSVAWRTDPGWRDILRPVKLANLDPADGAELLRLHQVPESEHAAALAFTHGHPLALALVADVRGRFTAAAGREVLGVLLGELVDTVPGPAHRAALEACAQVRHATEPVLAALLDIPDAGELFDWLRGLSIMDVTARGLFPHDLARDALAAELRWRHPELHTRIRERARAYYRTRFDGTDPATQQAVLLDYAYLHRDRPGLTAMLTHLRPGSVDVTGLTAGPATGADLPVLRELVERHEGAASAALFDHWAGAQPDAVQVARGAGGEVAGMQVLLRLEATTAAQRAIDPAAAAVWSFLHDTAPIAPGDGVLLVRYWLDREAYQDVSPVQTFLMLNLVRRYLTTPRLAAHFLTAADPEMWAEICAYGDMARLPAADFTVGGRRYGGYWHDWRVTPPLAWLSLLADRETAADDPIGPAPPAARRLDQVGFVDAVRDALRELDRPDRLAGSPLVETGLVTARLATTVAPSSAEVARAVEATVRDAAAVLAASVRDRPAYRALHHTYLQPAGTQAGAAELLDLPMSTYRRHLATGLRRLTAILWNQEQDTPH